MQLEERIWEQLEAAADREARRRGAARGAAAVRGALPARRLRAVAGLVAATAGVALAVALMPGREAPRPQIERLAVGGSRLGAAITAHGALWATDGRGGAVLRVDARTRRVRSRVPVPAPLGEVALASGPDAVWAVAVAPIRHSAPAPPQPRAVALLRIDPATARITARIALRAPGGATVRPVDVVALPGAVWVWGEGGALRVDPARRRVTTAIQPRGEKVLGFAAKEARVSLTTDVGRLVTFDAHTGARLGAMPFDGPLSRAELVAVGTDVVAYRRGGTLASVDPVTGRTRWAVRAGSQPRDLALSGGRLWVLLGGAGGDELRAVDPGTGRLLVRYALPPDTARTLVPGGATPLVATYDGDLLRVRFAR